MREDEREGVEEGGREVGRETEGKLEGGSEEKGRLRAVPVSHPQDLQLQ